MIQIFNILQIPHVLHTYSSYSSHTALFRYKSDAWRTGQTSNETVYTYAIRLAFALCRLLSIIGCRRYLGRNLWLIAAAYPLAHSQSLAAATRYKRSGRDRNVLLMKQGTQTVQHCTPYSPYFEDYSDFSYFQYFPYFQHTQYS